MPIRILIADSDPALLALYEARLSQAGFEVSTATNGFDCLSSLHVAPPRLLVLEPEMPWGSGVLDVMHDVAVGSPCVPIFVITSHRTFGKVDLSRIPLVTHIQTKPVQPDQLIRLIRHIIDEPPPIPPTLRSRAARRQTSVQPCSTQESELPYPNAIRLDGVES